MYIHKIQIIFYIPKNMIILLNEERNIVVKKKIEKKSRKGTFSY